VLWPHHFGIDACGGEVEVEEEEVDVVHDFGLWKRRKKSASFSRPLLHSCERDFYQAIITKYQLK
jgi:hypothetical protein